MEQVRVPPAGPPTCVVTLVVGCGAGPSKTFTLRIGDVLRVGRGPANDFVLALGGISTCHAELFLRASDPSGTAESAGMALYARDTSKNGTGVLSSSAEVSKDGTPSKWQALPRGGLVRLESGWRLLLPLRGLPKEAAELAHTLMVTINAMNSVTAKEPTEAESLLAIKAKTPRRKAREKKEKKDKKDKKDKREKKEKKAKDTPEEGPPAKRPRTETEAERQRRKAANGRPLEASAAPRRAASPAASMPDVSPDGPPEVPAEAYSEHGAKKHRKHRRHRRREGEEDGREKHGKKERRRRRRDDREGSPRKA